MKPIIGIVPTAKLFETDDYYKDHYLFVNNYGIRVAANGGVPMGLLAADGYAFEDALARCDGIVMCGGGKIYPYHFQTVAYAVEHHIPLLGICLGMQAIHCYFTVAQEAQRRHYTGSLLELYETMKQERYMFVLPVAHHWDVPMVRGHADDTKHPVHIVPGTRLHRMLNRDVTMGASLHRYAVNQPPEVLTVSARTEDGTIEGLEYEDYILGVQFHPEVDSDHNALFHFWEQSV